MILATLLVFTVLCAFAVLKAKGAHYKNFLILIFELLGCLLCFALGHTALAFAVFIMSLCSAAILALFIANYDQRSIVEKSTPAFGVKLMGIALAAGVVGCAILLGVIFDLNWAEHQVAHVEASAQSLIAIVAAGLLLFISLIALVNGPQKEEQHD